MATKRQAIRTQPQDERQGQHASPTRSRQSNIWNAQRKDHEARYGRQHNGSKRVKGEQLAQALGWFSIGLGLAEIIAPEKLAKLIGARGKHTALIRSYGLREITAGVGILTQRRPAHWVWSRVAGDVVDLASLGLAFASPKAKQDRLMAATAAVVGVTALDVICAQQLSRDQHDRAIRTHSITISHSPEEVYRFWRNFENLPRFMSHLESVKVTDDRRSHWVAKAPMGASVEWDAEITADRPNELIAWRSLPGSDVDNSGQVRFERAPGGRGTEVHVEIEYNPPGGILGVGMAKLFGEEPGQQIKGDLYRFKQLMETGEVVHSDSSIHRGPYPAQPSADNGQ